MKSLDQRLSEFVSPFDDSDTTQFEFLEDKIFTYKKESIINSISKKNGFQEFDLYFDEILNQLDGSDKELFLRECIEKLQTVYPIDVLLDYINIYDIIKTNTEDMVNLIRYFVYDKWIDEIVLYFPIFESDRLQDFKSIAELVKDSFFKTQEEIIKDKHINEYIRYFFEYCPRLDGEKLLMILIKKDFSSILIKQQERK